MKAIVKLARAAIVAVAALCSPAALAGFVDQGSTTLDTYTNLLWLDMSYSQGTSAQSILNGTDPAHLLDAGWSFASISQIETLFTDAGMSAPFVGFGTSSQYAPAYSLVTMLGETYSYSPGDGTTTHGIQAFSADGTSATDLYTPYAYYCTECSGGMGIGAAGSLPPFTVPSGVHMSSWLVMETVPEPGTFAMLLGGLGLMGFVMRRRRGNALAG